MYIPFDELPDNARVWVYTAERLLTNKESLHISEKLKPFIERWSAHGNNLKASCTILENAFIILGVDSEHEAASGCSIDSSVNFLREIEKEMSLNLLDWQSCALKIDGSTVIHSRNDLTEMIRQNRLSDETLLYSGHITAKKDLTENWLLPLKESSLYLAMSN